MNIKDVFSRENILLAVAGGLGIALKTYADNKTRKKELAEAVEQYMKKHNN